MLRWLVGLSLLLSPALTAQGPDADWRTLETRHFRLHYPAPAEAWTLHIAARLEAIRERVSAEVGYEPEVIADILVMDPQASPNGSAIPFMRRPRMVLWTTPPPPGSLLGNYRDWGEVLTVHEDVHLVHMLRPSRNRWQRLSARWVPIGPITRKSPRWLIEGYATVLEGQLTGFGRPNGELRAAILRRKAQLGELPSYQALDGDQRWYGRTMAYLMGSAYLEWLLEREGEASLRDLWRRLSAVQNRSFDDAFSGVFGDSPRTLYNRFQAELTYRALRLEEELVPSLRQGELWQDLTWSTGAPAISPDGERMALVLRSRDRPSRLVVWSTGVDEEAEDRWREAVEELRRRDPLDVPAVRRQPLTREAIHQLTGHHGAELYTPRWMPDGRSLLFVRFEPDPQGFLHPDLFRWTPEQGRVERLTRGADLRDADPAPDGRHAVAVRHRHGQSQLVRVELASGAIEPLTSPTIGEIYAQPRFSPDGQRLAFVRHRQGAWALIVRELASGSERRLPTAERGMIAHPAWSADGRAVFATLGERGRVEVHALPLDPAAAPYAVTRTFGAALSPAPTPDGEALFFLSLEADGLDLRRLEFDAEANPLPEFPPADALASHPALQPALPAPAPVVPELAVSELQDARPYGIGRQEWRALAGGSRGPGGRSWLVGARGGDIVGRLNYLVGISAAEGLLEGGSAALRWRGWPIELGVHLFAGDERPSRQPTSVAGLGRGLDARRSGAEVRAGWQTQARRWDLALEGGLTAARLEPLSGSRPALEQRLVFFDARQRSQHSWGNWNLHQAIALDLQAGETEGDGWTRLGGRVRVAGGYGNAIVGFTAERRTIDGASFDFDRLQLGGLEDLQLPDSLQRGRIFDEALPRGVQIGDEHESQRLDLRLGSWPAWIFQQRHRLWRERGSRPDWLELRGLEIRWTTRPMPLVRLPALDLRLGLAEILDPPFEDEVEGWFRIGFRP